VHGGLAVQAGRAVNRGSETGIERRERGGTGDADLTAQRSIRTLAVLLRSGVTFLHVPMGHFPS
jgi:hypothetical protein